MHRHVAIASLLVLLLPGLLAWAVCGPSAVCSDLATSFHGEIIGDSVRLDWSTDAEDSTVLYYKIKRYSCGDPNTCSVTVTTVNAVGSCATNHDYDYTDTPPSPVGSWTYTLEVYRSGSATRVCAYDVDP